MAVIWEKDGLALMKHETSEIYTFKRVRGEFVDELDVKYDGGTNFVGKSGYFNIFEYSIAEVIDIFEIRDAMAIPSGSTRVPVEVAHYPWFYAVYIFKVDEQCADLITTVSSACLRLVSNGERSERLKKVVKDVRDAGYALSMIETTRKNLRENDVYNRASQAPAFDYGGPVSYIANSAKQRQNITEYYKSIENLSVSCRQLDGAWDMPHVRFTVVTCV